MTWFLVVYALSCTKPSSPDRAPHCVPTEDTRVETPSLEVCRALRGLNEHTSCLAMDNPGDEVK